MVWAACVSEFNVNRKCMFFSINEGRFYYNYKMFGSGFKDILLEAAL